MATPSFKPYAASGLSPWSAASTCDRSYRIAALRGAAIALFLLGILALIVLY